VAVPFDDITAVEYRRGEVQIDRKAAAPLSVGSLDAPGVLWSADKPPGVPDSAPAIVF
jgi:hypothetical protein